MNSRERVQKVLKRELPDRLPFNFWMDRDLMAELDKKFGENFRVTYYGADVIETFFLVNWFPELEEKKKKNLINDGSTVWQIEPLISSITEAKNLTMPDPYDNKIYEMIKCYRKKYPDKAIFALLPTPLEVIYTLRLFEGMFLDFYDYPKETQEFVNRVGEILAVMSEKACSMDIDVLYIAGDICSSKGPLMSREQLVKYCFEPLKGAIKQAKDAGIPVFYHTDGAVMGILDLFVAYGIEGINPLQPHLNNIKEFKKRYGDKLIVYGGLDNCYIIPNGSVEDVVNHVKYTFEILGKGGGFIASTHDIPRYVPLQNIDAMVATIKNCRYI